MLLYTRIDRVQKSAQLNPTLISSPWREYPNSTEGRINKSRHVLTPPENKLGKLVI